MQAFCPVGATRVVLDVIVTRALPQRSGDVMPLYTRRTGPLITASSEDGTSVPTSTSLHPQLPSGSRWLTCSGSLRWMVSFLPKESSLRDPVCIYRRQNSSSKGLPNHVLRAKSGRNRRGRRKKWNKCSKREPSKNCSVSALQAESHHTSYPTASGMRTWKTISGGTVRTKHCVFAT